MDNPDYFLDHSRHTKHDYVGFKTQSGDFTFVLESRKFTLEQLQNMYTACNSANELMALKAEAKIYVNHAEVDIKLVGEMINWAKS